VENIVPEPMRKDEAHELVDRMAENATWDDLIDQIYVREVIEQGLADSKAGRTTDVQEVHRKYGLQP
jgi:predicted transcriptional regulator